jgi:hypothetical protein
LTLKPGLFSAAFALLILWGCGGSSPPVPEDPNARASLDQFFLHFRLKVQQGNADSLLKDLSLETRQWLEDIRHAARTEGPAAVQERPFHEVLCILALRVERRLNPSFDDRPPGLIDKLVVQSYPVKKTLLKTDLGGARVRGDEGEIGLREAPDVPVFFFTRENGAWKFNMVRSLPLILKGAESMARQRKSTRLEQAVFILEQFGNLQVLPEDLNR